MRGMQLPTISSYSDKVVVYAIAPMNKTLKPDFIRLAL